MNPLTSLNDYGQVVWLDFLSRRFIADGSLKRLIEEDGLAGATSNPSISRPEEVVASRPRSRLTRSCQISSGLISPPAETMLLFGRGGSPTLARVSEVRASRRDTGRVYQRFNASAARGPNSCR
jgi:hypothetical protein